MEEKKKRGCNYTAEEKEIFLQLVKKYQDIIENKETNAIMISKKRKAWDSVCQQYNKVAVSGSRTWYQLRHLYENIKQRSKKSIAKVNRIRFYEKFQKCSKEGILDEDALHEKEVNRSDDETFKRTLSEQDARMLAMVSPQVELLSNPDDAELFFGDKEGHNINLRENEDEASSESMIITNNIDDHDTTNTNISITENSDEEASTAATYQENKKPRALKSISTGRMKAERKVTNIKQQYFMAKLRNAKLVNKYLINKNKMEINKYKIEMQILKLRLKKLKTP